MKRIIERHARRILLVLFASAAGCMNSQPAGPTENVELLSNPSFEISGSPSLAGWRASDTALVHFSTDAPAGGGTYSVAINPGAYPMEGAVYTTIAAPAGTHVYQFRLWAKALNWAAAPWVQLLRLSPPAEPLNFPCPQVINATWTAYSVFDTISANPGDSITIGLDVDSGNPADGKVLFNHCEFIEVK